jgi:hypothetical protein
MGSQQILRAAALVAVTAVSATAHAQAAPPGKAPSSTASSSAISTTGGSPVVVVDLASGSADGAAVLRQELSNAGFALLTAPDLDAANAGLDGGKDLGEALAALELARSSFGALDCPAAQQAAEAAIATLAARGAAGIDGNAQLSTAWSYLLLCRDRAGDLDGAMRAAQALRALPPAASRAASAPAGVDAAVWAKYPEVDVTTNRDIVELTITAEPGAVLTIDQRPVGTSPATVFLPAGRHVVAAAQGSRRAALWIDLSKRSATVAIRMFEQDAPLSRISERVAGWKARPPDGKQVASYLENLLTAAQGRPWNPSSSRSPLLVLVGVSGDPRRAQLWASDGPGVLPEEIELTLEATEGQTGPQGTAVIAALHKRALQWREAEPVPEILVNAPDAGNVDLDRDAKPVTKWWVYAAIAGAVAVGGAVIVANELADDTQRIELRVP